MYRKSSEVLVKDVNIKFKRIAGTPDGDVGAIKQISHRVAVSKVALVDPETEKATKVYFGFLEDGTKVRVTKASNSVLPRAAPATYVQRHLEKQDGVKDTAPSKAVEASYRGEDFAGIKTAFDAWVREKEEKEKWLVFDL